MQEYNYKSNNNYNELIDNDPDICLELPDGYSKPWVTIPKKTYNKLLSLKRRGMLTEKDFYLSVIRFSY